MKRLALFVCVFIFAFCNTTMAADKTADNPIRNLRMKNEGMNKSDEAKTMAISFKWIGAATWILNIDGLKIASDPVLCPKDTVLQFGFGATGKRKVAPMYNVDDFKDIDIWLITHDHEDHLDIRGLAAMDPAATIFSNDKSLKILNQIYPQKLHVLKWNQTVTFQIKGLSIEIEAIPTVHASNFLVAAYLGDVNGYWVTIKKNSISTSIYVTGDTIPHKTVLAALKNRKADIIIPHMGAVSKGNFGGPFTLSADGLKMITSATNPEIIIPVHFGTFSHFVEPIALLAQWKDPRIKILKEGECSMFHHPYSTKGK